MDQTYAAVQNEMLHYRDLQSVKYPAIYTVNGSVAGQVAIAALITIDSDKDFLCEEISISCFSYDAVNPSTFPVPNGGGLTAWAARGLSIRIVDTSASREFFSGYVAVENIAAPAYGLNMPSLAKFKHLFLRQAKVRIDLQNRDNALRTHYYEISLTGFNFTTSPQ